jgi:hypothetical protein
MTTTDACARWIGDWPTLPNPATSDALKFYRKACGRALKAGHHCGATEGLKLYQVGPLCAEHQP